MWPGLAGHRAPVPKVPAASKAPFFSGSLSLIPRADEPGGQVTGLSFLWGPRRECLSLPGDPWPGCFQRSPAPHPGLLAPAKQRALFSQQASNPLPQLPAPTTPTKSPVDFSCRPGSFRSALLQEVFPAWPPWLVWVGSPLPEETG